MSKALRYLAAARPAAATHLLSFYKESVVALDDKTRHLIQIVTKVAVGTERGLRQYAPKALKSGASREEILDAVLMAFPAAGLNKVLDALDILLDMDLLPVVPPETKAPPAEDHLLGAVQDFPVGKMKCVPGPNGEVMVFRANAEHIQVYDRHCPHYKATLCKGIDHGKTIECRMHNWQFNLETGDSTEPGKPGLTILPSRVEKGKVFLVLG